MAAAIMRMSFSLVANLDAHKTPPPPRNYSSSPKLKKKQPPSVVEIERAVGAGIFRDKDADSEDGDRKGGLFDTMIASSIGRRESDAEKKLREAGEWLIQNTEKSSTVGKQILMGMFLWAIPLWILAFLVASEIIELPFHNPLLDDLIS